MGDIIEYLLEISFVLVYNTVLIINKIATPTIYARLCSYSVLKDFPAEWKDG